MIYDHLIYTDEMLYDKWIEWGNLPGRGGGMVFQEYVEITTHQYLNWRIRLRRKYNLP